MDIDSYDNKQMKNYSVLFYHVHVKNTDISTEDNL